MDAKKTPLYEEHLRLGGKMVEYAGWSMPVEYAGGGLVKEHEAVRNQAGIFDVSHMGEILIAGEEAEIFTDYLVTNDASKLKDGQVFYTFFTNEKGGVVDDLLVYRMARDRFYLVVNAANTQKDVDWVRRHQDQFRITVEDLSSVTAQIAVQGPSAEKIVQALTEEDLSKIEFFHFKEDVTIAGVNCLISRTGYTGEDGFEIYTAPDDVVRLWTAVLEEGGENILPAGLGCRDTLRFEAALPLYGNELNDDRTPVQAGFKFFVKLDKERNFIGKEALMKEQENGVTYSLAGLEFIGKGIPRHGYEVFVGDESVGEITTGYLAPTIGKSIANVLIKVPYNKLGTEVEVQVRKKRVPAKIISKFYLRNHKKNKEETK